MHLYTLFLPAYTLDTADVNIEHVDNKRYTMRDIGRIEKRIETAEYYTQLSLLERNRIYKYKTQMVLIDLKMVL